jgi:hypothetical protein
MTNSQLAKKTYAEAKALRRLVSDESEAMNDAENRFQTVTQETIHIPSKPITPEEKQKLDKAWLQMQYDNTAIMRSTMDRYRLHETLCKFLRDELRRRLHLPADPLTDGKYDAVATTDVTGAFIAQDLESMASRLPRESYKQALHDFRYGWGEPDD